MHFLYVKIPVLDQAPGQIHQLEDKVDQVLGEAGMGSVAGWGDSLGPKRPDGSRPVAFTRIDVDVVDLAAARECLQANLPSIGAPLGTEIHYTIGNRHAKDIYFASGWLLGQLS